MQYISTRKKIFILGPDNYRLLRDSIQSSNYFYFDPESGIIPWNIKIISHAFIYLFILYDLKTTLKSKLKSAYLTALIKICASEIVITTIDDSIYFFRSAKILHKELRFIAIQNGTKFYSLDYLSSKLPEIFIPELVCYGQYDQDFLSKSVAKIEKYYPIGSLYEMKSREVSDVYKDYINNRHNIIYDLCLISEDFSEFNTGIEEASGKIAEFTERYCNENNLKMVVALKNKPGRVNKKRESEISFFKRFIDIDNEDIIKTDNKEWFSSYDTSIQSQLTIGMASSLLVENASRGLKVLICDFYGKPWSLGIGEPLALSNQEHSYEKFKKIVDKILSQSNEDFFREREEQIDFLISKNKKGSLRDSIEEILNYSL